MFLVHWVRLLGRPLLENSTSYQFAYSHDLGFMSTFGDPQNLPRKAPCFAQLVKINLFASKSKLARPNIWRFNILSRLFCPSTGPLLTSNVRPFFTAS